MTSPVKEWVAKLPSLNGGFSKMHYTPRELAGMTTSEDWIIFSLHRNYVRPSRELEFYHGEPCRLRSRASNKNFELPPGSVYHYTSSMGHSATAWDPFLFPNPPRTFLMSAPFPHYLSPEILAIQEDNLDCDKDSSNVKGLLNQGLSQLADDIFGGVRAASRLRRYRRLISPADLRFNGIPPVDLDDLERQLWFDPEPRLERPFRTYADTKYCTKGARLIDVAQLMRPGW